MTNNGPRLDATVVAMSAVVAAAVAVATLPSIPIGIGYLNFGEIVIYTAAFVLGGVVGGLGGGIGAAAADVFLGWTLFAPFSLVGKGIEGFVVGRLAGESTRSRIIAVAAGAPFMITSYVVAVVIFEGIPYAGIELIVDIIQASVGLVVALPLSRALESRLPELQ